MKETDRHKESRLEKKQRLVVSGKHPDFRIKFRGMEILEHSESCLIRDWIDTQPKDIHVTIDLDGVNHLPSGFFGMIYSYYETGVRFAFINLSDRLRNFLWIKRFIVADGEFVNPEKPWNPAVEAEPDEDEDDHAPLTAG